MTHTKKVEVLQNEQNPIPTQVLADSIKKLAEGMRQALNSDLNERALVVLLQDATHIPKLEIKRVLSTLSELDKLFLKPKAKKTEKRVG